MSPSSTALSCHHWSLIAPKDPLTATEVAAIEAGVAVTGEAEEEEAVLTGEEEEAPMGVEEDGEVAAIAEGGAAVMETVTVLLPPPHLPVTVGLGAHRFQSRNNLFHNA